MRIKWKQIFFQQDFQITLCTSQKEFDTICKSLKTEKTEWITPEAAALMHTVVLSTTERHIVSCILCINMSDKDPLLIAPTLVHEAVHIKQEFMKYLSEETPSPEFEAYTVDYIFKCMLEEYIDRFLKLKSESE